MKIRLTHPVWPVEAVREAIVAAKGEIRAQAYGMLYDRIAVEDGGVQRYGSVFICKDHRPVLAPIGDVEHVNLWRNTMGFASTVEESAALIGKALPCS